MRPAETNSLMDNTDIMHTVQYGSILSTMVKFGGMTCLTILGNLAHNLQTVSP